MADNAHPFSLACSNWRFPSRRGLDQWVSTSSIRACACRIPDIWSVTRQRM